MTDPLKTQYEAYPYPARDPRDEAGRLITGSPSRLDELNHYVFGGRLDFERPFRVLVAGGGTGDGLIMLAQQCADARIPAAITYVDLSAAARAIAEARARVRGLTGITFLTGSLIELETLAPGPYDYIDCCGVLHHLPDPAAGLAALTARLAPGGGIGLMLYGAYGRTGVYPLQSALRRLTAGLPDGERLALARRLIPKLPATNWFARNPLLGDHRASDAGLYDLLLHSRDRAFTVPEIAELVESCGLAITALVDPIRYDPAFYINDPKIAARLAGLDRLERWALAEELAGSLKTHAFYTVRRDDAAAAVAAPDRPTVRPGLSELDGKAAARSLKPGQGLPIEIDGIALTLPLPALAGALLARINGSVDLAGLHHALDEARGGGLGWDTFKGQFDQLYAVLNGVGKLFLRG